jgi:hypothetical protein
MNMNQEFCSYKISKELKELGFDEPCICGYDNEKKLRGKLAHSNGKGSRIDWDKHDDHLPAPLWQQAFRWFRDKHSLIAVPLYIGGDYRYYDILIYDDTTGEEIKYDQMLIPKYEEAELECLEQLIEIVKKR